jgi:hypothetical protein
MKNRGLVFTLVALTLTLTAVTIFIAHQNPSSSLSHGLPSPNGWDFFMQAGAKVTECDDYRKLDLDSLKSFVADNAAALTLVRTGLLHESCVVLDYEHGGTNILDGLPELKKLGTAFCAEVRLAELTGHPEDALRSCVDLLRFSDQCSRGGPLIHGMVGWAIESLAAGKLEELLPLWDATICRTASSALENFDTHRQTTSQFVQNESDWRKQTFPGLRHRWQDLLTIQSRWALDGSIAEKNSKRVKATRQLLFRFAARAYELEQGKRPIKATDLVPTYLKAVPSDPATGKPMELTP